MKVYNAIDTLVIVLNTDPILKCAQVVANVRAARGLNTGEDSCFHAGLGEITIVNDRNAVPEIEVTIEKWVYGGDGLARADGKVVLVPFTLPGERVKAAAGNGVHAVLREVMSPAAERVPAPCPLFQTCGGCSYQHAPADFQLARKAEILREQLRRVGKIPYEGGIETISGPAYGYRNRAQFHISDGRIGYLAARSHNLVALEGECPLLSPRLNQALAEMRKRLNDPRFPRFLRSVELFTDERQIQVNILEADRKVAKRFFEWCESVEFIEYQTANGPLRVGPQSFFQSNRFLLDNLVSAATDNQAGETAWDLFAGVGLFTIPLAKQFHSVTAVESGAGAAHDLAVNAERSGGNIATQRARVEDFLRDAKQAPDFMLLDPPRPGLGPAITRELERLAAPLITIVSCDPATLARDVAALPSYTIERMVLVDLFPQTFHLESIVHLRRK